MLVWYHQWKQEHRLWPSLPACDFQFGALAKVTIEIIVASVIKETDMTLGEMQALRVLTTLQYLVEVGPKSPPAGQITQECNQSCGLCNRQTFCSCPVLC